MGIKVVEEVKKPEEFSFEHLFLSPRIAKIAEACMKDDTDNKDAQPPTVPGSKGARPAPASEEATSSARKL